MTKAIWFQMVDVMCEQHEMTSTKERESPFPSLTYTSCIVDACMHHASSFENCLGMCSKYGCKTSDHAHWVGAYVIYFEHPSACFQVQNAGACLSCPMEECMGTWWEETLAFSSACLYTEIITGSLPLGTLSQCWCQIAADFWAKLWAKPVPTITDTASWAKGRLYITPLNINK